MKTEICPDCSGSGLNDKYRIHGFSSVHVVTDSSCPTCGGRGLVYTDKWTWSKPMKRKVEDETEM